MRENMVKKVATRESYGNALARLGAENKDIVVLDADLASAKVSRQTYRLRHCREQYDRSCGRACRSRKDTFCQQLCHVCSRKGI